MLALHESVDEKRKDKGVLRIYIYMREKGTYFIRCLETMASEG